MKKNFKIACLCLVATCLFCTACTASEKNLSLSNTQNIPGSSDTLVSNSIYEYVKKLLPQMPKEQICAVLDGVVKPYIDAVQSDNGESESDKVITALYAFYLFYYPEVRLEIGELWQKYQVIWEYLGFDQSMKTRFDQAINSARAVLVLLPKIIKQESQLSQLLCDRERILTAFYCCTRIETASGATGCPTYYNPYIIGKLNGILLVRNLYKFFRETDYQNGFVRIIGELFAKKTKLPIADYLLDRENDNNLILEDFFRKEPTIFCVPDISVINRKAHLNEISAYLSEEFDKLGEQEFIKKYLNDFRTWLNNKEKKKTVLDNKEEKKIVKKFMKLK